MKKSIIFSLITLALLFTRPHPALAQNGQFSQFFQSFNQELIQNNEINTTNNILSTLINIFFQYAFFFAGIILLFIIIASGFQIMTAVQNPDQAQAGKQRLTTAIIGFLILFAAYWIMQIIEIIFGVNILSN